MSSNRRNILLGLTMLVGLCLFGWMIVTFGSKTASIFAEPQIPVVFDADRADGLSEGSAVTYLGVSVGRVVHLERQADQTGVIISVSVDRNPPLPGNVRGFIRITGLIGGGSSISLETDGPPSKEGLAPNTRLKASFLGSSLVPPELANTATEIGRLSRQFRESHVIEDLDAAVKVMQGQLTKAGQVMDSLQSLLSDPKMRADLQASLASIRQTSESAATITTDLKKFSGETLPKLASDADDTINQAKGNIAKVSDHVDDLSKQMSDRMQEASVLLKSFQSISEKVDQGKGTAGLLVNDPKLYASLVDSTRELNETISDLKRLVEQWEQEGISLKVK